MTAPIDGTVVQRHLGPGQWLGADTAEPAYTIADLSTVWLIGIARGRRTSLFCTWARAWRSLSTHCRAVTSRPALRAWPTRLTLGHDAWRYVPELQSADGALKPGMQASLRITLAEAKPAIGVPASALLGRGGEAAVWLVLGGDRIGLRQVRLGIRVGEEVEIVDGLRPGERIVIGGALFLDRLRMA